MQKSGLMVTAVLVFLFTFSFLAPLKDAGASEVEDLRREIQSLKGRVDEMENGKAKTIESPAVPPSSTDKVAPVKPVNQVLWEDGLRFLLNDGKIKFEIGGRTHIDTLLWTGNRDAKEAFGVIDPNNTGPHLKDGVDFRRLRLEMAAEFYKHVAAKLQIEFSQGDPRVFDAYLALQKIPYLGTARFGHFKEPFSLDWLTSSNGMTFVERASVFIFNPDRNVGLMFDNTFGKRLHYALGVFRETNLDGFSAEDNDYNITGRLTGLPVYEDDGRLLLHLGGSFSYRNPPGDSVHFSIRSEERPSSTIVNSRDPRTNADLLSDELQLYNAEAAFVLGPFSLQGEYVAALVKGLRPLPTVAPFRNFPWGGGPDARFDGYYAYMSYFLTGESRPYNLRDGAFERIKPIHNFWDNDGGWGAWEVALRYSHLDMQDGVYNGSLGSGAQKNGFDAASFGEVDQYTAGLNWYLNPNSRVMFNYTLADPDPNGIVHLLGTRVAFYF